MEELPFEKIKRKILVKKESETNNSYGTDPENRTVKELINSGVICLNKSQGPTSHQTAEYVKNILNLKHVGHGGTLDPHVTGVLPIALENATRITQTLLIAGKEYVALMHLHKPIDNKKILNGFEEFKGKIKQLPPIRSAVKRQIREREIYYIEIIEMGNQDVLFRIGCQAGTYIRKYISDFGNNLKTNAHMLQLVRTKAGPFNDKEMYTMQEIKDAYEYYKEGDESHLKKIIKPIEFATQHLPKIWVQDTTVDSLCHGTDLSIPGISKLESDIKKDDLVAVMTLKNELICLGNVILTSEEIIKMERGKAVKTAKVFMKPDIYPKWKKQEVKVN